MGAVPVHEAYLLRSANRATSPVSARPRAVTTGPTHGRVHERGAGRDDHLLQLAGEDLGLLLDRDELRDLFGGEPSAGLAGYVAGLDRREDPLGLAGGDVLLRLSRNEFNLLEGNRRTPSLHAGGGESALRDVQGRSPPDCLARR